jgi:signal transduction histidine kinase
MHAGQWEVQGIRADLCAIVSSAVGDVAACAAERRVTVVQELPETAMTVLDPLQMRGVVTALLENAIRFSPLEGQVTIRVVHDDDVSRLTVRDHGDGIALDTLPSVFEAFAHADITHHTQGHGLSLAIARHIVLAHNGTIEVESTPGVATTFTVRLPEVACVASGAHPPQRLALSS